MFIGHYAPALIAAAFPRTQRLGALFVAAQLVDLACFSFILLGIEHVRAVPGMTVMNAMDLYDMRYTHSLLGTLAFAALWIGGTRLAGYGWASAIIGGAVVLSHWFLDLLVHTTDLTLAGGATKYGLGLWNHPRIEMPLEIALTAGALIFYLVRTRPLSFAGKVAPIVLAATLASVQAIDWRTPQPTTIVDPTPPAQSLTALAAFVVLALLATWVGRTRVLGVGPRVRTL
jgi:hypothetical protein